MTAQAERQIGRTVALTRKIEAILETKLGARGKGLHEKAGSVAHLLPAGLLKQLRYIATVRNKMMHHEFVMPAAEFERFCMTANTAAERLATLGSRQRRPAPSAGAAARPDAGGRSIPWWGVLPIVALLAGVGYALWTTPAPESPAALSASTPRDGQPPRKERVHPASAQPGRLPDVMKGR